MRLGNERDDIMTVRDILGLPVREQQVSCSSLKEKSMTASPNAGPRDDGKNVMHSIMNLYTHILRMKRIEKITLVRGQLVVTFYSFPISHLPSFTRLLAPFST